MAAKSAYYLFSDILKGSPLESEEQLSTMCPKVNVQMTTVRLTAYGHVLQQNCSMTKVGVVNCVADNAVVQPPAYTKGKFLGWSMPYMSM
jgi:hypothetical protein